MGLVGTRPSAVRIWQRAPSRAWETGFVSQLRALRDLLGEEGLDRLRLPVTDPAHRPELGMQSQAPKLGDWLCKPVAGRPVPTSGKTGAPSRTWDAIPSSQPWETGFVSRLLALRGIFATASFWRRWSDLPGPRTPARTRLFHGSQNGASLDLRVRATRQCPPRYRSP
jgi:hypothetical protein